MPYGQYTGYEPLPNGQGYILQTKDGTRFPAVGAEAENIRRGIDRANSAPTSLTSAATAAQPAAPPAQAPPQQAATPSASRLFTQKDGSVVALRDGGDPRNPAHYVKNIPGSAGSRGGLAEMGRSVQGGYAVDDQFLDQMEQSNLRMRSVEDQGIAEGVKLAAERKSFFDAEKNRLENEALVQAHEASVKQKRVGDLQAKLDQAESDYVNFHENREKGVAGSKERMANFIGGLAGALGALGASLARTPNFAAEAVARHQEMQMRREEAELRVKKDAKDSLLGRLQQETGSLDLAKSAYRAIHSRQAALGWEALAQKEQDQGKQMVMLRTAEIHNQQALKERESYLRLAEGETTRTLKMQPGRAASGPRQVGLSIEEASQLADLTAKNASTAKTETETGKTRAELASGGGAGGAKLSDTSANSFANIAAVRGQLPSMLKASENEGVMAARGLPIFGGVLETDSESNYQAKARTVARLAGKAVEGDAAAESNVLALEADLTSPLPAKRAAAMKALDGVLAAKEREMKKVVPGAPK